MTFCNGVITGLLPGHDRPQCNEPRVTSIQAAKAAAFADYSHILAYSSQLACHTHE